MTRAVVVLNTDAGGGRPDGFEEALTTHLGLDDLALYEMRGRRPPGEDVRRAIAEGFDLGLAAGAMGPYRMWPLGPSRQASPQASSRPVDEIFVGES